MGNRTIVPLIYGAGVDRATGIFTREGRAGYDLRNILLLRDRAQVRRGHAKVNTILDDLGNPVTDVLLESGMQGEQIGILGALGNDGRVHLFRCNPDGTGLQRIGTLFTNPAGALTPPRIFGAEQDSKFFVAHDEPELLYRQPTVYYDPYGAPALQQLTADLDGDGIPGAIHFRGLTNYLTYVVGWGWGTETDPDHPETIRVDDSETSTLFNPNDYLQAGWRGTPVLNCLQAGDPLNPTLMVFKPTEIYQIFGYDPTTFGIKQVESGHGIPTGKLAYSLGGVVFFWDADEGPRRTAGGPSEDLGWPLNLNAPTPADLVAEGALSDGFICYQPGLKQLFFVFGQRVYVLSLWDPTAMKWSYGEIGFVARSGGIMYSPVEGAITPPTGAASSVVLSSPGPVTFAAAWDNNGLTGGEIAELWVHDVVADTWALWGSVPASGATQTATIDNQEPSTEYEMQIRYRRGVFYGTGYTDPDPANWPSGPSGSLSNQVTTTAIAAPVLSSLTWSRVSSTVEQVELAWTGDATLESVIYHPGGLLGPIQVAVVPAGTFVYDDTAISGETYLEYFVTQKSGVHESNHSSTLQVWTGPANQPHITAGYPPTRLCNKRLYIGWSDTSADLVELSMYDATTNPSGPYYPVTGPVSSPVSAQVIAVADGGPVPDPVSEGDFISVRLRYYEVAFGVTDYGPADVFHNIINTLRFTSAACA